MRAPRRWAPLTSGSDLGDNRDIQDDGDVPEVTFRRLSGPRFCVGKKVPYTGNRRTVRRIGTCCPAVAASASLRQ